MTRSSPPTDRVVGILETLAADPGSPLTMTDLARRLGLYDTWAYFSVKSGTGVAPQPDRSGQAPATSLPARLSTQAPAGPQGGAVAPGRVEPSSTGGVAAP